MGKINLNSITYNIQITREDILKYVTQEQIFSYYMGEDIDGLGLFHSPVREDNIPSFSIYFHKYNKNVLMFKDHATKDSGDFVSLVRLKFDLDYKTALEKIAFDMGLSELNIDVNQKEIVYSKLTRKDPVKLGVKIRDWYIRDKDFWLQFGIRKSTLKKFNVYPIEYVFFNNNAFKAADLAYAYVEEKDGEITYKIYQPLESKIKKWINNANYSVHQGYRQLPEKGELLIITKSLKDVMSFHDCLNVSAIGLQSETVMMKDSVMDEYKSRFKFVICIFDNDKAGKELAEAFSKAYSIPACFIPIQKGKEKEVKDFSDLVKYLGKEAAVKIMKKIINKIIKYDRGT